jgi:hypothetical protein
MPLTDPSKILFSTSYKYFLNYDDKTGSVSVPSTSYGAGVVKSYSVTIPITRTKDFSQIRVNFSFDSSKWYVFPFPYVVLDSNFSVETVGSYSGSNLIITFYVVNQVPLTVSNTAFTATVDATLFVTPT